MRIRTIAFLAVAVLLAFVGTAYAAPAAYPNREIRYIIPYQPGGLSDITSRKVADIINQKKLLPVQVVVVNIDGASGGTGMMEVRGAARDGYTLMHHHTSMISQKALGVRNWGFEAYEPVAMLFNVPAMVVVPAISKFKTFDALVQYARQNPGKLRWNISSVGGGVHLLSEVAMRQLDIDGKVRLVAYGSGGPSVTALLAGEDDVSCKNLPEAISYVKSGQFRILAIGTEKRLPDFPDVPTFKEIGIDTPLAVAYRMGVWAPKGTPPEILSQLRNVFEKVIKSPEFEAAAKELGIEPMFGDGEMLRQLFTEDAKVIEAVVKELNLKG